MASVAVEEKLDRFFLPNYLNIQRNDVNVAAKQGPEIGSCPVEVTVDEFFNVSSCLS